TAQIRFQPSTGQFLAAASESVVSIFDVETHTKKYTLQVCFSTQTHRCCTVSFLS
uniref:Anaphase-promoting complex subunit 4 WD40 domain-containing protein n=1 Tax=Aegilops tauschii subsp. strangulata TaxID=200361 RepID=A0A453Q0Q1_AEGTS